MKPTHHLLLICVLLITGCLGQAAPPATLDSKPATQELGEGEQWFDDWFTITELDETTFAIGEPLYWQKNYNYLIVGEERALLLDSGPGVRDITPVVDHLTSLPVTVTQSHAHFDHIGNHHLFDVAALADVPSLVAEVDDDVFHPCRQQYLKLRPPEITVSEWLQPGEPIDLGGRQIIALHTPGHTEGSMTLLDRQRRFLFTGDFLYPGTLLASLPGSSLIQYLDSTNALILQTRGGETIYGAHATSNHPSPSLEFEVLTDLAAALAGLVAGDLEFRRNRYTVNDNVSLTVWRGWTAESDGAMTPACDAPPQDHRSRAQTRSPAE